MLKKIRESMRRETDLIISIKKIDKLFSTKGKVQYLQ